MKGQFSAKAAVTVAMLAMMLTAFAGGARGEQLNDALAALRGTDVYFDWRNFHSNNADRLWPHYTAPAEGASFNSSLTISDRLVALSFNGIGRGLTREILADQFRRDTSCPDFTVWLDLALGRSRIPALPVVGLGAGGARALAMEAAFGLCENPQSLYLSVSEQEMPVEILLSLLYAMARNNVQVDRGVLDRLARVLPREYRLFAIRLAMNARQVGKDFLKSRLDSELPSERGMALLALSMMEPTPTREEFAAWSKSVADKGGLPALRLASLAMLAARDEEAWASMRSAMAGAKIENGDDAVFVYLAQGACGTEADTKALFDSLPWESDPLRWPFNSAAHLVFGCAQNYGLKHCKPYIDRLMASEYPQARVYGALAIGVAGDPDGLKMLQPLYQDASYDVRAACVLAARMLDTPYSFGLMKRFVSDKHHQELSALASLFIGRYDKEAATRLLSDMNFYIFDREKAMALLSLSFASGDAFGPVAEANRGNASPYVRRYNALGALFNGKTEYWGDFAKSLVQYQDYEPFGTAASLRRALLAEMIPFPFGYLADYVPVD
ncbi:MAG: HEAT repeat domain-containing protein [Candidatus Brocadiia bacterium]